MEKLKDQKVQDQQMVGADELPEDALDQAAGGAPFVEKGSGGAPCQPLV